MWSHIRFAAPQFFSAFIRRLPKIYHKAFQDFSRKRHLAESLVLRELITDGHHLSRSCDRCLNTSTSPLLQQLDACPVGGVLDKNLVATLETWGNERLKVPNLGSQPWNGRMKDGQFLSVLARTLLDFWVKLFLNLLVELELEDRRGSFKHWISQEVKIRAWFMLPLRYSTLPKKRTKKKFRFTLTIKSKQLWNEAMFDNSQSTSPDAGTCNAVRGVKRHGLPHLFLQQAACSNILGHCPWITVRNQSWRLVNISGAFL